ncbi:hypothetical protein DY467_25860, partial [Rhodopseudomonas sp. BR0G17]|nr:hypothetical protein [Rhodopseudomonas sp. BR0G17]
GDRSVRVALRSGVVPDRFFELIGRGAARSDDENAELSALKRRVAGDVLAAAPDTLFDRL